MTYTTHNHATSAWQILSDLKASLAERHARNRAYRSTVSELSAMSDRDLTDIGICRADIASIARQAAYGA
jgi:uncharacterized protein YjiS (DUF1127 family)